MRVKFLSESEEVIWKQLHGGFIGQKTVNCRGQIWNLPLCRNKLVRKFVFEIDTKES